MAKTEKKSKEKKNVKQDVILSEELQKELGDTQDLVITTTKKDKELARREKLREEKKKQKQQLIGKRRAKREALQVFYC